MVSIASPIRTSQAVDAAIGTVIAALRMRRDLPPR
jgi:hypothetical protein